MKTRILALAMLLAAYGVASAQSKTQAPVCKKTYLGIQTGINNHNGLIGLSIEQALAPQWTFGTGIGVGSWGWKLFAEGRYYFRDECYRRTALGLAFTHASGFKDLELKQVETNYGKVDAFINGDPVNNLALSFYRFWPLGKKQANKFYIHFGYAVRLAQVKYQFAQETSIRYPGIKMTDASDRGMQLIAPGGLIIALGFYFGM